MPDVTVDQFITILEANRPATNEDTDMTDNVTIPNAAISTSSTDYLSTIEDALTAISAANTQSASGDYSREFDKSLAASITWSLAGSFAYYFSELGLVDHPKNPRRARSPEAAAEKVLRLETICDETLGVMNCMAARASQELLPPAEQFFPEEGGATPNRYVRTPRRDPEEVKTRLRASPRRAKMLEATRVSRDDALNVIREEYKAQNGGFGRLLLERALTNNVGFAPDNISPQLALKIFKIMLAKLGEYTQKYYEEALNNPSDQIAEEAEGIYNVLEDVRQRLGVVAYHANHHAETSRFEPARDEEDEAAAAKFRYYNVNLRHTGTEKVDAA